MGAIGLTRRRIYLVLFAFILAGLVGVIFLLPENPEDFPKYVRPLVDGYGGNLSAEIVGSLVFLLLAFYLDAEVEEKIDHIREAAAKSESILSRREDLLRNEMAIAGFESFQRRETYHDVRFPDLKSDEAPLGLQYTIEPVRDPQTGEPARFETETSSAYLVKVREPAYWDVMDDARRAAYENSPIRENEFYFCRFFNDDWHMGAAFGGFDCPYRFYLSGKLGPMISVPSANEFAESFLPDPFAKMQTIASLPIREDGLLLVDEGSCTPYDLYVEGETLFLRIGDSPPKRMHLSGSPDSDSDWSLEIENMRGYGDGRKLANVNLEILRAVREHGVSPSTRRARRTNRRA